MSRRTQLLTLSLIVGVSIVFGMVISSSLYRVDPIPAQAASRAAFDAPLPVAQAVTVPSFADIAERANPAVVAIRSVEFKKVRRDAPEGMIDPFHWFFGPDGPSAPNGPNGPNRRGRPNTDRDGDDEEEDNRRQEGSGSGFIIRKDGYVLTNFHVVDGASKLTVDLEGGERYEATVKGKDESTDLALLKINAPHDLPTLPLGNSDDLRIGEWVMAIGNPLGSELGEEHSVTIGVVSAKGRQLRDINRDPSLANYIQTDAAINFGNSGGPLLNARGEVIGINTAITRNYGNVPGLIQGIGFALPIDMAKGVLDQLMTTGKVARGALGIGVEPVTEEKRRFYDLPDKKGAFVQDVRPDGPSARAGLQKGDIIKSIDGKEIGETSELIRIISAHRPGDSVSVGVFRDGRTMNLKVKLVDRADTLKASHEETSEEDGAAPTPDEKPVTAARLGFTVSEITSSVERDQGIPRRHVDGVIITKVDPESSAWEAGLVPGIIVTQVGRDSVSSVDDFRRAAQKISKGHIVRLSVTRYLNGDERSQFVFYEAE